MEQTLIRHPRFRVDLKTGSEGPRHDPYHFTEMCVTMPGNEVVIHEGLGVWIKHNGKTISIPYEYKHGDDDKWCRDKFQELVGHSIEWIERMANKIRSRCRVCGGKHFDHVSGFPGETLVVCCKCGNVQDGWLDRSAIE